MCIELAFSIQHDLQMFKTINESIEKIEQQLNVMTLSKNLPEIGTEVPSISPYKLAIRVIVDNCTSAEEAKGVKYVMG